MDVNYCVFTMKAKNFRESLTAKRKVIASGMTRDEALAICRSKKEERTEKDLADGVIFRISSAEVK